ncbi:unnamed protein product [Calicophoron daubneyi]|uniref:Protein KASH5 EF-hand-like domain-containing protein n=1 Tax=Calicophoron daubneyi TaxID=300641 RepID=A0AAV2T1X7_CALDB
MRSYINTFLAVDRNKTGIVFVSDLEHYLKQHHATEEAINEWKQKFDPYHTGFITRNGFCERLGVEPAQL